MHIVCIGAGYVGVPTMAVLAKHCPTDQVFVVDISNTVINAWNSDDAEQFPVYEPGLADLVRGVRGKNLVFSSNIEECIAIADVVFVAVNTPTKSYGSGHGYASDTSRIDQCARTIANRARNDKRVIVVEKSTVPVHTADIIRQILESNAPEKRFDVLSNPEFLAEGTAITDIENPS